MDFFGVKARVGAGRQMRLRLHPESPAPPDLAPAPGHWGRFKKSYPQNMAKLGTYFEIRWL